MRPKHQATKSYIYPTKIAIELLKTDFGQKEGQPSGSPLFIRTMLVNGLLYHAHLFTTLVKAATHLSRCSISWPAETWTRIRAWPLGTTE